MSNHSIASISVDVPELTYKVKMLVENHVADIQDTIIAETRRLFERAIENSSDTINREIQRQLEAVYAREVTKAVYCENTEAFLQVLAERQVLAALKDVQKQLK